MAALYTIYPVVNNAFSGNGYKIRYAGDDSNPLFVAQDIFKAMGHKYYGNCRSFYKDLPGKTEVDKGTKVGSRIMIALTKADVEVALSRRDIGSDELKKKKEEFRKFWRNEVLPQIEHPEIRGKIVDLENKNNFLVEEVQKLRAEIAQIKGQYDNTPEAS